MKTPQPGRAGPPGPPKSGAGERLPNGACRPRACSRYEKRAPASALPFSVLLSALRTQLSAGGRTIRLSTLISQLSALLLTFALLPGVTAFAAGADDLSNLNETAQAAHRKRNIGDASALYRRILEAEPPAPPTPGQRERVLRFAPRLFNVAGEFFPLKDIAAIVHPERPVIAYHLFWADDIAYPADNEPCDHEIVWVEYDPATERVVRVSSYFHGRIVSTAAAAEDANAHGGRPWVGVEWGFHGSVLRGSLEQTDTGVAAKLKEHWTLAHERAAEFPRSPLARGWPTHFAGEFADYTTFSEENDPRPRLRDDGLIYVSRWATATLNRYCLRYNFAAKTEWPWLSERNDK